MIEVRGVDYSVGTQPLLSEVDLTFEPGRLTAVSGPSGSGKTTASDQRGRPPRRQPDVAGKR
jgi:ABC-type multidrug transport system ATPase subunit